MLAPHESFCVSSLAALREVSSIKPKSNMSKAQAEVVLGSFVAKGWLLKTKYVIRDAPDTLIDHICTQRRPLLPFNAYPFRASRLP